MEEDNKYVGSREAKLCFKDIRGLFFFIYSRFSYNENQ